MKMKQKQLVHETGEQGGLATIMGNYLINTYLRKA